MDRLEQEMQGQLKVVRLDIHSSAGRELGARWGFRAVPTFILFDAAGREIQRAFGRLDPEAVKSALGR